MPRLIFALALSCFSYNGGAIEDNRTLSLLNLRRYLSAGTIDSFSRCVDAFTVDVSCDVSFANIPEWTAQLLSSINASLNLARQLERDDTNRSLCDLGEDTSQSGLPENCCFTSQKDSEGNLDEEKTLKLKELLTEAKNISFRLSFLC